MPASPPESQRGMFQAAVTAKGRLCLDHYRLTLRVEAFPPSRPGQFVNCRCGPTRPPARPTPRDWPEGRFPEADGAELRGRRPLLRRPISLAGRRDLADGASELTLIFRVVGVGTAWLAERTAGDTVGLAGPLGRGFVVEPGRPGAVLIGGGVGIPPMLYLAEALSDAGKRTTAFAGARTAALLPLSIDPADPPSQAGWPTRCAGEFAAHQADTAIATDDGSLGLPGLVSDAFERWLDHDGPPPEDLAAYACGPEPMMRAVAGICADRGIPCQLALERHMACGVGTCQGCVVKVRDDQAPAGWRFALACKDGPVFPAEQLIWGHSAFSPSRTSADPAADQSEETPDR